MGFVGYVAMVIGSLWLVWLAFKESILWGLGCLFIPLVTGFFAITRWPATKTPALLWLIGWVLIFVLR